jgi:hypothetical protein
MWGAKLVSISTTIRKRANSVVPVIGASKFSRKLDGSQGTS